MNDYPEITGHFIDLLHDYITEFESHVLRFEKNPNDTELFDAMFRTVHNIKGGSGNLGLTDIYRFAHNIEDSLLPIKNGDPGRHAPTINSLLSSADLLRLLVEAVATGGACDSALVEHWVRESNSIKVQMDRTDRQAGEAYGI